MNGRERLLALLRSDTVDCLPLMPITMMFAADQIGRSYRDYVTDYRVLVEGQRSVAAEYDIDYVSCISDPAREAADCGATVRFFDDQPPAIVETDTLLADKSKLNTLEIPDPSKPGRLQDRVQAAAMRIVGQPSPSDRTVRRQRESRGNLDLCPGSQRMTESLSTGRSRSPQRGKHALRRSHRHPPAALS